MMLKRNMKVKVSDGDTNFFDINAGVRQGDALGPYLCRICQDYVLQMSIDLIKENGFTQKNVRFVDWSIAVIIC